jgi:hypothetical protein
MPPTLSPQLLYPAVPLISPVLRHPETVPTLYPAMPPEYWLIAVMEPEFWQFLIIPLFSPAMPPTLRKPLIELLLTPRFSIVPEL